MGAVWAAIPSIGIQLHFSHASSPRGSVSKSGNEEQMLLAPLQPSSILRCNPRFRSRRCLPTWASRFTSMDLIYRMATSTQCPWASIYITGELCYALFFPVFTLSDAAWKLNLHLLWGSQTYAIHATEVVFDAFDDIWAFQLVWMPVTFA